MVQGSASATSLPSADRTAVMMSPDLVRCTYCGATYDLLDVHVTHRHADCSVWQTPCCDRQADDRMFKSRPSYTRLSDLPMVSTTGFLYYNPLTMKAGKAK